MILDSSNIDTFIITQDGWWNQINNEFISYYKFETNPKAGSTYSIEVNHIDYESVYATTTIPNDIELIAFDVIDHSNDTDTTVYNATLNVTFDDAANQRNYYRIRLFIHTEGYEQHSDDTEVFRKNYPLVLY